MNTTELLRGYLAPKKQEKKTLDSADGGGSASYAASSYAETDIAISAVASVNEWLETEDMTGGEGWSDRLMALMIGIADANKDGDITDDEQDIVDVALNAAFEYLVSQGVPEEDAGGLLNDWDEDAAIRVRDLLASSLGDDESGEAIDNFIFGDEATEPVLDAAYKKKLAIRNGRKTFVMKRVSGTVRLSAGQKAAIRKAGMRAHSATAKARRLKSSRMRRQLSL